MPVIGKTLNKTVEMYYNRALFFNKNKFFCVMISFRKHRVYWCF